MEKELAAIAGDFAGRLGACVQSEKGVACTKGDERFSMQSVMKLLVGMAVLDAVDRKGWRLDEEVVIRKQDLSLYVQPLAKLVGESGFRTTVGDLVRRAIIQSDSAATDYLIGKLGGPMEVQRTLRRMRVAGLRLDRDERHLQTEIVGLQWRAEYTDAAVLDAAILAVPDATRATAYAAYSRDARDTATPRGMASFLFRLQGGKLLTASSTAFVLRAMEECVTFPDRLKAGVPDGWKVAHKTGTSGSWQGLTAATNDVGLLTAPDGTRYAVAVFAADSRASAAERAAVIAKVAAVVAARHR
jgi:beta-lactamase class A